MRRRLHLFTAICLVVVSTGAAFAQPVPDAAALTAPARSSSSRAKLDGVCMESLARFCPALANTPGQTRNQVICLKPYRSSLPLNCRSAVTAALR